MSERRIVVDPVTRIEGHLRVQAVLGDDGKIVDSMSTGTMWRGLEVILKGRDPRDAWAFVERICGVCTGIHALSAVRAVEDAIGIKIPKNANLIRNILNAMTISFTFISSQRSTGWTLSARSMLIRAKRLLSSKRFRRAIRSQLSVTSAMCRTA